jgi:hypothetical protein
MKEKLKKRKKRNPKEKERQKEEKDKEMGIWIKRWRTELTTVVRLES